MASVRHGIGRVGEKRRLDSASPFGAWRSLVARGLWVAEVPGSNPGAPIGGLPPGISPNEVRVGNQAPAAHAGTLSASNRLWASDESACVRAVQALSQLGIWSG
jgi:hypothetical protein